MPLLTFSLISVLIFPGLHIPPSQYILTLKITSFVVEHGLTIYNSLEDIGYNKLKGLKIVENRVQNVSNKMKIK
jgi:hypothetical protein